MWDVERYVAKIKLGTVKESLWGPDATTNAGGKTWGEFYVQFL